MARAQPYLTVAGGVGVAIVFVALAIYYATAAAGAPHLKHMILFVVLAVPRRPIRGDRPHLRPWRPDGQSRRLLP